MRKSRKIALINLIALSALLVGVLFFSDFASENVAVRDFVFANGYYGLFLVAIISGFNFLLPIPAIAFLPIVIAVGLDFWVGVVIVSIGMTIGDVVGYFLGRTGRKVIDESKLPKFMRNCDSFIHKHPKMTPVILFLYAAFIPLPNELIVIPFSFFDRHWSHIIWPVLAGNFVFNSLAALGIMSISGIV